MTVDRFGTTTAFPHLGHLPRLPASLSSVRMDSLQFEQANLIMG